MLAENRIFQKKLSKDNNFVNILKLLRKIIDLFLNIRRRSDKLLLETLIVDIGVELSEIFDFGYLLGSGCDKNAIYP